MSLYPLRICITILSVAGVVFAVAVFGSMFMIEAGFFHTLSLMFETWNPVLVEQVVRVLFGLVIHFGIMFAALAVVLSAATDPFVGNGRSSWLVGMKKWQYGNPLQKKPAVKPLKR